MFRVLCFGSLPADCRDPIRKPEVLFRIDIPLIMHNDVYDYISLCVLVGNIYSILYVRSPDIVYNTYSYILRNILILIYRCSL